MTTLANPSFASASDITPSMLGMEKTIELTAARRDTFHYRGMDKRRIDHRVIHERRWKKVAGPLVYAVTDASGAIRYIGKWVSPTPLCSRWVRHDTIHHQERTRNLYIEDLDAGRGPIAVWSVSVAELLPRLPTHVRQRPLKEIAEGLEAVWIQRWKQKLDWNHRIEPVPPGFEDGEFWRL